MILAGVLRFRLVFAILIIWLGIVFLLLLAVQFASGWELGDFHVTFYRTARYFWQGENVYLNSYPHPYNGREYPPFNPIWGLYFFVPFGGLTLPVAEALRMVLDVVVFLPLLVYLTARWAHLPRWSDGLWLAWAPWLVTQVHSGQLTPLTFLGVLLCYWGVRKPSALITAVGLLLVLVKFALAALVVLATLVFAQRQRILLETMGILCGLVAIGSLAAPLWFVDLASLYLERLAHPRISDSVLLFPGYPWGQIGLLLIGALFLFGWVWYFRLTHPSPWLWAVLVGTSLVGALHSFIYDWQLLMPLIAVLLHARWGKWLTAGVYLYPLVWGFLMKRFPLPLPSVMPALILLLVLIMGLVKERRKGDEREH